MAGCRIVWPEDPDAGATHAFSLICLSSPFLLPACSPIADRVMASSLWQQRYLFLLRLCQNTTVSVLCSTNGLPEPSCANGFRLQRAIWYMARGHGFFKVLTHGAKRKAKPPFSVETIRLTFGIPSCYGKHEKTTLSCIKSA